MMPNRSTDDLLQLIHSLQKGERRNFKLYVKRNSSNEDLKIIRLFDVLDRMKDYDESLILTRMPSIRKDQLANRKAHLYKQILASLRILETADNIDIQLREQMDHARILYNRGLYLQSLKVLDRTKEVAKAHEQASFLIQVLFMEKKIESLHITRSLHNRARHLSAEANTVTCQIELISRLSNLALELYGWYITNGHARNEEEELMLAGFFRQNLPAETPAETGFYQRLYRYQCYCWYAFIRQDFLMYYRYTQKWVDLFQQEPLRISLETSHYIKGLHNLASAHFDLRNYEKFDRTVSQFEAFAASNLVQQNKNNSVQVFAYLYTAKINRHFLFGSFDEGLALVPFISEQIKANASLLDRHRVLVFYYKIASLYFGSGDFENTVVYLNKIINWKVDLRTDLQCYARLLHLIAHYELGNINLLEYLVKSVYRFMAKMENLGPVEKDMFVFLQHAFTLSAHALQPEFVKLLSKLKMYEADPLARRAFAYLDIISWLESKITGTPVQQVIAGKAAARIKKSDKQKGADKI